MFNLHRYLLLTLDPLHVGTGGYRLGRVDLSIVREPGTGVPKVPGTSLSGAARAYAAQRAGQLRCAGQGQPGAGREGHCGHPVCPICYTFGSLFSRDEEGKRIQRAYAGTVNLSDARLIFFPVATAAGPVWVTTRERLAAAGFPTDDPTQPGAEEVLLTFERSDALNLGWLLLDTGGPVTVAPPVESDWGQLAQWQAIAGRIGLVQESLFGQVANANLEVRTSVSIDPITGAAEEGALFTYEALPRAAWLLGEIIVDDYRHGFPSDEGETKGVGATPLAVVETGLKLVEYLGIGGMGTRGFGRAQLIGQPWLVTQGPEVAT